MLLLAVAAGALLAGLLTNLRPARAVPVPPFAVTIAAVAGALVVGLADASPTGWTPFDVLLRAGFGALAPIAAARAGTLADSWLQVVAVVVVVIAEPPGGLVTALAGGAFLALAAAGVATPPVGAIAATTAIGAMAHADWNVATGASATAMAVATLPVLLAGLWRTPPPHRRRFVMALTLIVFAATAGAAVGGLSALRAESDVDAAIDRATDGIELLGDDGDEARRLLRSAADHFDDAEADLRAWWARPALLVPGVAQQSRAVSTMASAGADLARTAATASEEADVDSIRPRDGAIDLDALTALQEPLDRSLGSLRTAAGRLDGADSPLLLRPVADRLSDLRAEVDEALVSAELAAEAVAVAPDLLGADGPRRYFVAFQQPAEQRGNGGFLGSWAELTAVDGRLSLSRSGRYRDLTDEGEPFEDREIRSEPEAVEVYGEATKRWGLLNFSPDNPTVSRLIAELYPQSGGAPLDGVVALTPAAVAAFLELTGPVEVAGYPEALTADNARRVLLHDQYLEFPQADDDDREAFLAEAVRVVFEQLTSGDLPGPTVLADQLGPAVAARDLQLWSADPAEQQLFRSLGATGAVQPEGIDSFGVVTQNFNGNKIDWFLERSIAYDIAWDPESGEITGDLSVTLENHAPDHGLPHSIIGWGGDVSAGQRPVADGENYMMVTLYAVFPITSVTVDGAPVEFTRHRELGHGTARFFVAVPPSGSREIRAEVAGTAERTSRYVVQAVRQPTANPDDVTITVEVPPEWGIEALEGDPRPTSHRVVEETTSDRPVRTAVEVSPADTSLSLLDRLRGLDRPR